ncbi:prohormone-1-like [Amphibalanus amphitrite]|uniref:C-type allatostatin n=1 Tax=Amphibalanus amphitrite TaxID=1232801 RepID=I3VN94_AMPAM|nr:prohormone-1-like [Amphibalanus amphitrite]AFK81931.1 C-type allatostatin [Amphibalanus amphitrite]
MTLARLSLLLTICVAVLVAAAAGKSLQKDVFVPQYDAEDHKLDVMPDDGTAETALLNYLYARQMLRRLSSNLDVTELQRKRSYWKQCSFNAVSCFG